MTVKQMASAMPMREFALWRIKYNTDPWGEKRADLRFARLMALYANAHRSEGTPPFTGEEFMPQFEELEEEEDVTEETTVAPETKAWLYAMAGKKPNGN